MAPVLGAAASPPQDDAYQKLKAEAEAYYEEGSYRRALDLYERADTLDLPDVESRWVDFRIGDTMWRNQAATRTSDNTVYERARERLQEVLTTYETATDRDDLWAAVHTSLGDMRWDRHDSRDWNSGWNHYAQALDYWAGHRDLDRARDAYLGIVFHIVEPTWIGRYPHYRQYVYVPADILENAVEIAQEPDDRTRAQYLLAMAMRQQGGWRQQQRVEELFAQVIEAGDHLKWYDDALFFYAEWLSQQGRPVRQDGGSWSYQPDYRKSVELYRRLTREFGKGESAHYDDAKRRIEQITTPTLGIAVSNIFLPGSEVQFHTNWRNVGAIEFSLYSIDLTEDIVYQPDRRPEGTWADHVDLTQRDPVRSWVKDTEDTGDYIPGSESITLEEAPATGAYLLVATAGGKSARDIILVTDATMIVKSVADESLVYVCDAIDGSPLAGATVAVWEIRRRANDKWFVRKHEAQTDEDGLVLVELNADANSGDLFIAANSEGRQAFSSAHAYAQQSEGSTYRIYAHTDRPAYRPGDTVQWKMTARIYRDSVYTTPSGQTVTYEITDPRGTKVTEGQLALNDFGSAWDELSVGESMPLGEYHVQFWTEGRGSHIGNAALFRLEEYKLPEYEVTISTGEDEDGKPRTYQVGDRVEAEISAQYYFGAPVANADVEVIVYQRSFWWWWQPERSYGWLYEDANPYRYYWQGQGGQIKREQIKTDAEGKAIVAFDTPLNAGEDFEYTIEARVVDSSRREVSGAGSVRVTRQRYFVHAKAMHNIHQPGDSVEVTFTALDANRNPVETTGRTQVWRDVWTEIWLSPEGVEVTGKELAEEKARYRSFPPPAPANMLGWRLVYRGYKSTKVLDQTIETDEKGEATLTFKPQQDGYYRVEWQSEINDLYPIYAQTFVWVCSDSSRIIGYHQNGVDIIVDKDTFRSGQTAPVMISTQTNKRHVLFSIEGNDLHDYQLIRLEGTVKLVNIEVRDEYVPNVWLHAAMVQDAQLHADTEQIVVPPVDHFLNVDVTPVSETYQPGETGSLTIRTSDADGQPVSAEIGLTVVDESIYYIQQELAGDPREFFFNDRQSHRVQTGSTFNQKSYVRWKKDDQDQLIQVGVWREDEAEYADESAADDKRGDRDGRQGRVRLSDAPAPPMQSSARGLMESASAPGAGGGGGRMAGGQMPQSEALAADAMLPQGNNEIDETGGIGNVRVRSDFRETAVWTPSVITDADGMATIEVPFPDSTTRWKAIARSATEGSAFGIGDSSVQTRQPLIVRLQGPRFFVVGDETFVSAVINNNTDDAFDAKFDVDIHGLELLATEIDGRPLPRDARTVTVPANGTASIDWRVRVTTPGEARITATARAGEHSDGMERSYTVHAHGIEKHLIKSGKVRGDDLTIAIDLPAARGADSTKLSIQITPSMAITMLDALPYLIEYPYGCTEQTMSRFLPAAIVARTLKDLNVDPELAMSRVFGGITDAFAGDHADQRKSLDELDAMIDKGLARLYDFQHGDGGWGWWKEYDSDHYMSAYVVWGLSLALEAGVDVDRECLHRGAEYLRRELVEEEGRYDNQAWMLHALAAYQRAQDDNAKSKFEDVAIANLWENRDRLNAFTRALFALAVHTYGDNEKAQILIRNLENGVKVDDTPDTSVVVRGGQESHAGVIGTAHWGADGVYWRWSEGPVEATALALKALLAIDPDHELIEPVTNWLVKNRRGAQWSNTRDSAIAILALNDYLKVSGELEANLEYELVVNEQSIARRTVNPDDLFKSPSIFEIDAELLQNGRNDIRIVRHEGDGPVYFLADASFFSEEEPITPAGHEIFARRDYYKLVPYPTLLKGYEFDRVPMKDGDSVKSGERIEVVLTIEAKNDYEYLIFEDLKPAGLEAVQVQSGTPIYARELRTAGIERRFESDAPDAQDIARDQRDYTGRSQHVYQELRDRHVAMFFNRLPEGVWEVGYELRAEVPGDFHALPLLGHAMYVPEIRCNSAEIRMTVYDR